MDFTMSEAILSDAESAHWRKLIDDAKKLAKSGKVAQALLSFKQAAKIQTTEKLLKRIKQLEDYIKANEGSSSSDEESDAMAHVGNGFYLYKTLYDNIYAHQREGVLFLWKLYKEKRGGVLGDDMGLGKTIQVIAFLSGMIDAQLIKSVLIVAPVAVIVNWQRELEKWAPGLDVYEFHSQGKNERARILSRIQRRGGICLTSYGIIVNCAEQLSSDDRGRDFCWDYVILDEGHKIKNPTNKCAKGVHAIPSRNRIVLTGTPVMNNLKELWSLYDWTHEGRLLGRAATFVKEFETPIMRAREKGATAGEQRLGHEMSLSLSSLIKPYLLRRTKMDVGIMEAGRQSAVGGAPKMPTLTRKNDLVAWVHLSETQKQIYQEFLEQDDVKELLNTSKSPLTALTVLKKICDHPRLMTNRQCVELGLKVGAHIDVDKLDAAIEQDPTLFDVSHVPDNYLIKESGKMVFLVKLLDNLKEEGHRCLIFSASRRMIDIVEKVMRGRGHKMCRLDGRIRSKEERETIIKMFEKNLSYTSFLLTTQVGGVGLTLTAADRVVIIDPSWNPATDSQAVDRAFRIGQTKNVVVYRLITCGSIEEKIYRRQIFKDSVTKQTTGDSSNPFRYFTRDDLRELFTLGDTVESETQKQLAEIQHGQRKSDTSLDQHIAFLHSLDMFGISDHDLMFTIQASSIVEGAGDQGDMDIQFVQEKASKAKKLLDEESQENQKMAQETGKYIPAVGKEFNRFLSKTATATQPGPSKEEAKVLEEEKRLKYSNNAKIRRFGDSDDESDGGVTGQPKVSVRRPIVDSDDDLDTNQNFMDKKNDSKHHLNESIDSLSIADKPDAKRSQRSSLVVVSDDEKDERRQSSRSSSSHSRQSIKSDDDAKAARPKSHQSIKSENDDEAKGARPKSRNNFVSPAQEARPKSRNSMSPDPEAQRKSRNFLSPAPQKARPKSPYSTSQDHEVNTPMSDEETYQALTPKPASVRTPKPSSIRREEMVFSPKYNQPLVSLQQYTSDGGNKNDDVTPQYDAFKSLQSPSRPSSVSSHRSRLSIGRTPRRFLGLPMDTLDGNDETNFDVTRAAEDSNSSGSAAEVNDGSKPDAATDDNDDELKTDTSTEDDESPEAAAAKWGQLMSRCKTLYKAERYAEAYQYGEEALRIHDGNEKANSFVEQIRKLVFKDEDDRESDGPELEQLRQDQDASMSAIDSSAEMTDEEDEEEEEEEDLTTEQEEEYVTLMQESKRLYKMNHFQEALDVCDKARAIWNKDERVEQFHNKLMRLNQK